MDNQAFKKLLQNASSSKDAPSSTTTPRLGSSTPGAALGSRLKSSIPMTPRSVSLSAHRGDFARQLAEKRNGEGGAPPQTKKFRTSAPRGSRFADGYVDRARQRKEEGEEEEDERAARLAELEKRFKGEEIDRETYERLRGEIAGGDLGSTHLVKGLDFKLLERVRKGEDVFGAGKAGEEKEKEEREGPVEGEDEEEEDPDDALERLAAEVKPVEKERVQKKGMFATAPGQKRSRDQILAELKAAREAAKAKAESALGSKFKKIGERPKPGTRIERDAKGREVMIIVDEDGNERRKVRRIDLKAAAREEAKEEFKPMGEVLGMEVPEFYRAQQAELLARQKEEEEKEISIFDDAGSDYDPLAGMDGSSDESDSQDEGEVDEAKPERTSKGGDKSTAADSRAMPPPPRPAQARPNYFKDSKTGLISAEEHKRPDLNDPTVMAALRKAKALEIQNKSEEEIKAAEREAKLKKMLEASSRDDADMDMGFGSSRLEDEADLDETRVKLSQWGEEEDDEGGRGGGKAKRKRGGKKRKGDKDSFKDVMSVIERRKGSEA